MPTAAPPSPLGVELRWMRKVAGMSGQEIATRLGVTQVAVSRWETGKRQPEIESVEALRSACADVVETNLGSKTLAPADRRRLTESFNRLNSEDYKLTLARLVEDGSTEVLSTYVITRTGLIERQEEIRRLESQAKRVRHFQPLFVPGQLQTLDYARLVMQGYEKDPRQAERAARARMDRGKAILAGPKPEYHVVIAEPAFDVTFDDAPSDLRLGVLRRIHMAARRSHITVQIMPRLRPYVMVPIGSFVAFDFGQDDSVVLVDTYAAQVSYKSGRDVRLHDAVWNELIGLALDPQESTDWLANAIHDEKG